MQDSGDEPDDQQAPTTHRRSGLPQSIVRYRQLTLVFIKPASGSLERVFLGQLLEPVVEQFDVGGRTGEEAVKYSWEVGERAAEECSALFKKPNNLELEKVYWPYFLYSKTYRVRHG